MVLPLISFESLHGILNGLLEDMMPLCGSMTSVASAIAGLGAMLYICYRVWKALANAEPIDLFPLLRPFALGICIVFFQSLVLGGINDIAFVHLKTEDVVRHQLVGQIVAAYDRHSAIAGDHRDIERKGRRNHTDFDARQQADSTNQSETDDER